MTRIIRILLLVVFALTMCTTVDNCFAGRKKKKTIRDSEDPGVEITLIGEIKKREKEVKRKESKASYVLIDAKGNETSLPIPEKKEDKDAEAAEEINLDDYLNVNVKVVGEGTEIERKGKKYVRLKTIISVTKTAK